MGLARHFCFLKKGGRKLISHDKEVVVIGSGLMGSSISLFLALKNVSVILMDLKKSSLVAAEANINIQLTLMQDKGVISEEQVRKVQKSIEYTDNLLSIGSCWMVIEAIPENLELKQKLFSEMENHFDERTIFATNTSGLKISDIGKYLNFKERLIGTHFYTPAHIIPLVEVVQTEETSPEVVSATMDFLKRVNKKPVHIKKEVPGFIGNRIQSAIAREALSLLQKGVATAEDIDEVVRWSIGLRLVLTGPIEQRDINGLDIHYDIASYLYQDLESNGKPPGILEEKVKSGQLGLKTGEGFYQWSETDRERVTETRNTHFMELLEWLKRIEEDS
jgi:3-hydroxybutyryl-CoA dehydrogenase